MTDNLIFTHSVTETTLTSEKQGQPPSEREILIYQPQTKNGVPLTGYIGDFLIVASMPQHRELILPVPALEDSEEKKLNDEYEFAKTHECAMLEVYSGEESGGIVRKTLIDKVAIWNRQPLYRASILERLTTQKYYIVPPGKTLWARIAVSSEGLPDNVYPWLELLNGEYINIVIRAYEEGLFSIADLADLRQQFYTLNLVQTNAEYEFTLPAGCQGYSFKCRGDIAAGDAISAIKYSWQQGMVLGTSGYDVLPESNEESEFYTPPMKERKIYFSPTAPNTVLTFKLLVK